MNLTPILSTSVDCETLKSVTLQRCGYDLYRLSDLSTAPDLEPMFQVLSLCGPGDPRTNVADCRTNGGAHIVTIGFLVSDLDPDQRTLERLQVTSIRLHCGHVLAATLATWIDKMFSASKRDSTEYRSLLNLVHAFLLKAGLVTVFRYSNRIQLPDGTYLLRETGL